MRYPPAERVIVPNRSGISAMPAVHVLQAFLTLSLPLQTYTKCLACKADIGLVNFSNLKHLFSIVWWGALVYNIALGPLWGTPADLASTYATRGQQST